MIGVPWLTWHVICNNRRRRLAFVIGTAHVLQGCFSTRSPLRHSLARFQNPDQASLPRSSDGRLSSASGRWLARAAEVIKNRPRLYGTLGNSNKTSN
jgi:hypothetical protein